VSEASSLKGGPGAKPPGKFFEEKCSPDDVLKKKTLGGSNFQKPALYAFKPSGILFFKSGRHAPQNWGASIFKIPALHASKPVV